MNLFTGKSESTKMDEPVEELSQDLRTTQISNEDYDVTPRIVNWDNDGDRINGVDVHYDIDSVVVATSSLKPFKVGESIKIHLEHMREAHFSKEKKLVDCLKMARGENAYTKRVYYALPFAGDGKETIELAFQFKIDKVPAIDGISKPLARLAMRNLLDNVVLPAALGIEKWRNSSSRGIGFLARHPENISSSALVKELVYGTDWQHFAHLISEKMNEASDLLIMTNVIFTRSRHGGKACPETCEEVSRFFTDVDNEDVLLVQFHVA